MINFIKYYPVFKKLVLFSVGLSLCISVGFDVASTHNLVYFNLRSPDSTKNGFSNNFVNFNKQFNISMLEERLEVELEKASRTKVYILLYAGPGWAKTTRGTLPRKCGSCEITNDTKLIDDPRTKAVIFHFWELLFNSMPRTRRKDQYYVWWSMESSRSVRVFHKRSLQNFDNIFNLTMSYRRDSDIFSPYGTYKDLLHLHHESNGSHPLVINEMVKNKKKLALWVVSNCGYTKGAKDRMVFMRNLLNAGLNIDLGGNCFPNGVKDWKYENYKFYFALENSDDCKNYITEKAFHALQRGVVPVVSGPRKKDYEDLVPPNSYIFAGDYSVLGLVEYLNYLNNNDTAYARYFDWRAKSSRDLPERIREVGKCQLCRVTHGINVDNIFNSNYQELYEDIPLFGFPQKPRTVQSLSQWFYGYENDRCLASSIADLTAPRLFVAVAIITSVIFTLHRYEQRRSKETSLFRYFIYSLAMTITLFTLNLLYHVV